MNANPWLVDSVNAFSFLNCPECAFRTKGENLFAYHAAKNHPLSSAFYDQQIELENSSIGLKTVEYNPDLNSKLEAIQTRDTDESNDPLACKEQLKIGNHSLLHDEKCLPSVPKVIEIVPKNIVDEPTTCQHCEKELISISKLQTHYKECPNIASHDESFGYDFENINSGEDEGHEDFADGSVVNECLADESLADEIFADESLADECRAHESLADESLADECRADGTNGVDNIAIKDELSESATKTAILKNPINVKKIQNERRKTTQDLLLSKRKCKSEIKRLKTDKELCTQCGISVNNLKLHLDRVHNKEKQICTKCGKVLENRNSLRYHMMKWHDRFNDHTPEPDSNYEVVCGERENTKLYVKDGFLYRLNNNVRKKKAFFV